MVRSRASSFHRTVRFNTLLLESRDTDSTDESNGHDDGPTQDVNGSHSKKISQALADDNYKYVEFRRILKSSPSSRKTNGSRSRTTIGSRSLGGSTSFSDTMKSGSFLTTDMKIAVMDPALETLSSCSPPSPKEAAAVTTTATAETAGERDDEPTPRNNDDNSIDARSNSTLASVALTTHVPFSIPEGDRQDMKVVCNDRNLPEVQNTPAMPIPLHPTDVVVAVEASSVSPLDCAMRRGILHHGDVSNAFVPGCDFVGTVVRCGEEAFLSGISEGERVASIVYGGCNARFVVVSANALVKVPDNVDPSEAAGALLPYLTAFQALNSGINPPLRYKAALTGKSILVAENTGLVGLAIASLAKLSNAKETFLVCPFQLHERAKSLGAIPLNTNSTMWSEALKHKVDIMVETSNIQISTHLENKAKFLKASGRLVRIGTPTVAPSPESRPSPVPACLESFCAQSYLSFLACASYYEIFFSVERNQSLFKNDLTHILTLLSRRNIRPNIEKYVLLQDVAECHQEMEKFQMDGAIVCEPWRRGGFDSMIYKT